MARRTWNLDDTFFKVSDLQSYVAQNNVSVKRTKLTTMGKKVTYRCSKYRKYPQCDFQVNVMLNDNGEIIVSTSGEHNHDCRAETTRAPSPVRDIVRNAVAIGLTESQTRRTIQRQYEGTISYSQIKSLLSYHRSVIKSDVYSVDDFRSWCHQRSEFYSDPKLEHEPFVPKYYINSCDDLFVFITTRKLISTAPLSNLLQVDATFKLNWNEFPVIFNSIW